MNISRQRAASGDDIASEPRLDQVYFVAHVEYCSLVRLGVVWSGLVRLASHAVVGGGRAPLSTSVSAIRHGSPADEPPKLFAVPVALYTSFVRCMPPRWECW